MLPPPLTKKREEESRYTSFEQQATNKISYTILIYHLLKPLSKTKNTNTLQS